MTRERFNQLYTVRLEHESRNGCAALCQEPDGTRWTKLSLIHPTCQREFLDVLDENVPVRLEGGVLEVLLPWQEGLSLSQWLQEQTPTLGQRRDACLALLEQQLELRGKLPPCVTALSACSENLVWKEGGLSLQYLPDLRNWCSGMTQAQAICGVASVIWEAIAPASGWDDSLPEELKLLYLRQREREYTSWGQLQRDVAQIPDGLPQLASIWRPRIQRLKEQLCRYGKYILAALAAVLLTAAIFSLAAAFRQSRKDTGPIWPGMPQVGDQDLRGEEGGG